MIRVGGSRGVTVKGRATSLSALAVPPTLRLANVSEQGLVHLGEASEVQVEFVMMATKVMFVTRILAREQNSLSLSIPAALVSIERRKNARFICSEDLTAFLDMSKWKPGNEDLTAPPAFAHHLRLASYLSVADLSYGGMCVVTRFPAAVAALKRGLIDDDAKLILPLQEPLAVGVEIRWVKRLRESVLVAEGPGTRLLRSYRFGLEFVNQSDAVRLSLRQFIQQISQAGAI